jgi:Cys-rich repeat protein
VELLIASSRIEIVEIPGLVTCSEDADCPTGETCQPDLKCQ